VESNWVHSALQPLIGLLCQPRVIMMMEKLVEWLAGKPKYSEETCPSAALSTTNPTCCPDANPGHRGGKPATNRLSYGTASVTVRTWLACELVRCLLRFSKGSFKLRIIILTYGAEPFLRSCQLCSHSTTSQHFKEPEGSSPCSQKPSTGPYPEPDRFSPYHPILST
jgi:hypothetical protein